MRQAAALGTILGLAIAYCCAPFQHVHPGFARGQPGLLHAHFLPHSRGAPAETEGVHVEADDDHAHAISVDTFTVVLTGAHALVLPPVAPAAVFRPAVRFAPAEIVEQRGHDPPSLDTSIPRAPPLI